MLTPFIKVMTVNGVIKRPALPPMNLFILLTLIFMILRSLYLNYFSC